MRKKTINSINPFRLALDQPARRVQGGSKASVQQNYEGNNSGLLSRIYSAPAVANTDAETGDPIGAKANMVDNIYQQPSTPDPTNTPVRKNFFADMAEWLKGM